MEDTWQNNSSKKESSLPFVAYTCLKFPDCGWIAINHVPESVVHRDVHDVTVEVEYYWVNPGRDGWIVMRSNGPGGVEQYIGNDINTHKEFFRANEWATWTVRLKNTYFGTRSDGTDLFFFFGADPDDECYIRSVKVYETATPENFAAYSAVELQSATALEVNTEYEKTSLVAFDLHKLKEGEFPGLNHWHSGVEVILGRSSGRITINGASRVYQRGDILFVNPDQIRTVDSAITGACYYLVFDLAILEPHLESSVITDIRLKKKQFCNYVPLDHPAYPVLKSIYQQLVDAHFSSSPYKEMKIRSLLLSLLYECGEHGLIVDTPHADATHKMDYIRNAIVYMEAHLAEPVSVGDIAAYVHLSEAYFSRHFKTYIGDAPLEHLNHMRVKKAAELLLTGSTVTETALGVGIPNVGHFIRLFKKQYGQTPYQWQKQQTR